MYLAPVRRPGLMLVLGTEAEARRKAQTMTFQLTSDPVDFVKEVVRIPRSKGKGHVVLAPPADTDFSASYRRGFVGLLLRHARRLPQPVAEQYHVHGEVQGPEGEFPRGCISRPCDRHSHVAASLERRCPSARQLL